MPVLNTVNLPVYKKPNFNGIISDVVKRYDEATEKYGAYNSMHEAFAVLLEEVDEFKHEVWKKSHDKRLMREELLDIAAVAIRAIYDLELE